MRSPIHVRTEEILGHVQGHSSVLDEVFAPQADGLFATSAFPLAPDPTRDIHVRITEMLESVSGVLSLYDALVDDETIPDVDGIGRAKAAG